MIKIPLDGQVMAQRAMDAVQLGPQMHGHKIQYLSVRNMNQYDTRHANILRIIFIHQAAESAGRETSTSSLTASSSRADMFCSTGGQTEADGPWVRTWQDWLKEKQPWCISRPSVVSPSAFSIFFGDFGVCSVLSIGVIEGNFGGVIVFLCQHPRDFAEGSVHLVWSLLVFFHLFSEYSEFNRLEFLPIVDLQVSHGFPTFAFFSTYLIWGFIPPTDLAVTSTLWLARKRRPCERCTWYIQCIEMYLQWSCSGCPKNCVDW